MTNKNRSFYYSFVKNLLKVLGHERVSKFPHRNDPRKYGVWVNVCLLVLRALEGKSYRRMVKLLAEMPEILQLLGVEEVPHWTTLHKAAGKIPVSLIERLVASFVSMTRSESVRGGIDATGLQPTSASYYYIKIIRKMAVKEKNSAGGREKKKRKKRRKVSRHIKLSTVMDLDHQLAMAFKIRRGPASDLLDAASLVRKAHQVKPLKSLDADKGYTDDDLRKIVVEECGAEDRIKFKNPDVPVWRTKGVYLKKAKRRKLRRNGSALCETFHSILKRITGSTVRAVKVGMQNREVAFKILACSTLRKTKGSLIEITFLLSLNKDNFISIMALITFNEIFDLAVMILAIGFIFKDYVPSPKKEDYDPLKELEKRNSVSRKYFRGIKEGMIVAAPAVILHEAAHKIAAIFYGFEATFHAAYLWLGVGVLLKALSAPLFFFIPGYVTYSASQIEPLTRSLIAFAGPLANLLLFLFATLALKKNWLSRHSQLLSLTKQINLFLFIFNLLPLEPFDGADVFKGLIEFFFS